MTFTRSEQLWERSKRSLAGGVSSHHRIGEKPVPLFFERAKGSKVYDVDGNEYVDYFMGNGPAIFGHAPDFLLEAVKREMERGLMIAGQHRLEFEVAELVTQSVPCADLIRYATSGTEAVLGAIRLARAYTGRSKIVKFEGHYHGWSDPVIYSVAPSLDEAGPYDSPVPVAGSDGLSPGTKNEVIVLPWNNLALLTQKVQEHKDEIAAVIMEPVACNTNGAEPVPGYLEGVWKLCDEHGIVLIFDEVITGFRLAIGGAQAHYGITPDLATFAKAAAGGLPLAFIAGKKEIMEQLATGKVMLAGTANGNIPSLAAAKATLLRMQENDGALFKRLHEIGTKLMQGILERGRRHEEDIFVQGPGHIFKVAFTAEKSLLDYRSWKEKADHNRYAAFRQALLERGVRTTMNGTWFLSTAHSDEDIERTLAAVDDALKSL